MREPTLWPGLRLAGEPPSVRPAGRGWRAAVSVLLVCSSTLLAAPVVDRALLAPGPLELLVALDELESRVLGAQAAAVALQRTQNALAEGLASSRTAPPCDDAWTAMLAARSPPLGAGLRDRVQASRAQLDRVRAIEAEPTVAPVVTADLAERLAVAGKTVDQLTSAYLGASAWQKVNLGPFLARCKPQLETGPGPPPPALPAAPIQPLQVAVVGVGGGRVCPIDLPADNSMVVLTAPLACYGVSSCDCLPLPVSPGAVVGPARPLPPPLPRLSEPMKAATGPIVEEGPPGEPPVDATPFVALPTPIEEVVDLEEGGM